MKSKFSQLTFVSVHQVIIAKKFFTFSILILYFDNFLILFMFFAVSSANLPFLRYLFLLSKLIFILLLFLLNLDFLCVSLSVLPSQFCNFYCYTLVFPHFYCNWLFFLNEIALILHFRNEIRTIFHSIIFQVTKLEFLTELLNMWNLHTTWPDVF